MGCSMTCPPPRDADGSVEPHDHREILDDDILLRGIPKQWIQPAPNGGHRISSAAFNASSDTYGGLSLAAKKALECLGRTVDDWAAGRFSAVVCFPAEMLRSAEVQVGWDPVDNDSSHCNAWAKSGDPFPRRRSLRKRLANETGCRFFAVDRSSDL